MDVTVQYLLHHKIFATVYTVHNVHLYHAPFITKALTGIENMLHYFKLR